MASLNNLSDRQNMLITQFPYFSDKIPERGKTISELYLSMFGEPLPAVDDSHETPKNVREDIKVFLQEMIALGLGDLTVTDFENDSLTGFGAVALTDAYGNHAVSYRGTDGVKLESLNDWVDNVTAMGTGTSAQTLQAIQFYERNKDESGNNYLFGHSKGGQLAQAVYVESPQEVRQVHLLNPQPVNGYSLTATQLQALNSDKVDILVVEGDYVWFLGDVPNAPNIRVIKKQQDSNAHFYESIDWENSNTQPGNHPWLEYPVAFAIECITSNVQVIGGIPALLYHCVAQTVEYFKQGQDSQAEQYGRDVAKILEKVYAVSPELTAQFVKHQQIVTYGAKTVFQRGSATRNAASVNDSNSLKVNTVTLRNYADRLSQVNKRLAKLEDRIDRLYAEHPQDSLKKIATANSISSEKSRISNCAKYLTETADDIDSVERTIASMF